MLQKVDIYLMIKKIKILFIAFFLLTACKDSENMSINSQVDVVVNEERLEISEACDVESINQYNNL